MMEAFMTWYGGNNIEQSSLLDRAFGQFGFLFWLMILCNVIIPQALWLRRVRTNVPLLFFISLVVNVGMWTERFVIVVQSLSHDFMPSAWGSYAPTIWDIATFVGTIGLFAALLFMFIRVLPMISMFEMRELLTREERAQPAQSGVPAE
jgi:Ni/Fe-hydrogenase subunit HybB-like protein